MNIIGQYDWSIVGTGCSNGRHFWVWGKCPWWLNGFNVLVQVYFIILKQAMTGPHLAHILRYNSNYKRWATSFWVDTSFRT